MSSSHPARWIPFFLCGALSVVGCVGSTDSPQGETGSLSLDLVLADGTLIDEVDWLITGGDMEPMGGTINTSAPRSTASIEVFGLPPSVGQDYTITMEATDGETTCEGSEDFGIDIGKVTDIMVILHCKLPQRLGAVRVNGKFNICAELAKAVVSPLQTSVGNDIDLSAIGVERDGDPITYTWSGSGGSIADPNAAFTTYTCQDVGDHFVNISVTDNDEVCDMAEWTIPVTCVLGDGGTGGTGGDGGAGGQGGVGGAPECVDNEDCPQDDNECTANNCVVNTCVTQNVEQGMDCVNDAGPGFCDGEGTCVGCNDDDECGDLVCVENECVECGDIDDCALDEVCVADRCVSDPDIFCDGGLCAEDPDVKADCAEEFLTCLATNADEEECIALALLICNECNDDQDCDEGFVCDDNNECVVPLECIDDMDCDEDGNPCTAAVCANNTCGQAPANQGGSCASGTGSGDGSCNDAGTCVSNDECVVDGQCPEDDGNECTVPVCIQTGAPYVCDEDSAPADGNECEDGAGTCDGGACMVEEAPATCDPTGQGAVVPCQTLSVLAVDCTIFSSGVPIPVDPIVVPSAVAFAGVELDVQPQATITLPADLTCGFSGVIPTARVFDAEVDFSFGQDSVRTNSYLDPNDPLGGANPISPHGGVTFNFFETCGTACDPGTNTCQNDSSISCTVATQGADCVALEGTGPGLVAPFFPRDPPGSDNSADPSATGVVAITPASEGALLFEYAYAGILLPVDNAQAPLCIGGKCNFVGFINCPPADRTGPSEADGGPTGDPGICRPTGIGQVPTDCTTSDAPRIMYDAACNKLGALAETCEPFEEYNAISNVCAAAQPGTTLADTDAPTVCGDCLPLGCVGDPANEDIDTCRNGPDDGLDCTTDADCTADPDPDVEVICRIACNRNRCVGGANDGAICVFNADCPGGTCNILGCNAQDCCDYLQSRYLTATPAQFPALPVNPAP